MSLTCLWIDCRLAPAASRQTTLSPGASSSISSAALGLQSCMKLKYSRQQPEQIASSPKVDARPDGTSSLLVAAMNALCAVCVSMFSPAPRTSTGIRTAARLCEVKPRPGPRSRVTIGPILLSLRSAPSADVAARSRPTPSAAKILQRMAPNWRRNAVAEACNAIQVLALYRFVVRWMPSKAVLIALDASPSGRGEA